MKNDMSDLTKDEIERAIALETALQTNLMLRGDGAVAEHNLALNVYREAVLVTEARIECLWDLWHEAGGVT